jgi:hypothetical protein
MLNKVTLIGNLGADPEVRYMASGGAVTTIRLATTRRWKDKQTGERRDQTEWHRVVFFNIGNYHLSHAYGGVCLHRMHNDGGGCTAPLIGGHVPKRELAGLLSAFIAGIESHA